MESKKPDLTAHSEFFQVGMNDKDIVGEYFASINIGNAVAEVKEFKNSDTRLSLMKVNNRVKAFVIETRTEFNDLEFVKGTVGNSEVEELKAENEKLRKFKEYVHDRLDKMGVPSDPEPENNKVHGCRIEGRLNVIKSYLPYLMREGKMAIKSRSKTIELLDAYSNFLTKNGYMDTDWKDEPPYAIDEFLKKQKGL